MSTQSIQLQRLLEGKIDFEGQKLAEKITRYVLISATTISLLVGGAAQSLRITFGMLSFATLVLAIVVLPPWSLFNQHPVKWLPVRDESKESK